MKNKIIFLIMIALTICLTGCSKGKIEDLAENVKKIQLTGNLVTYQAYYHNVIEYDKNAGSGISHLFEKDRRLFAEYTGTIKLGIDMSKVKIEVKGKEINVFIPIASVIGEPNVDKDDFKTENFIEDDDGFINKNPLTLDDSTAAFEKAQKNIKDDASNNKDLLSIAQKRAKVILEENIRQLSGLSDKEYNINWEYGV